MNKENCALKLVDEIILYYVARSKKHKKNKTYNVRNTQARSLDHFCSGKAISFTNSLCICSRRYPACNAPALYCCLWPTRLHNIFPHYPIEGTNFGKKKLLKVKYVL